MTDRKTNCIRSFKHALAPVIILLALILVFYGAVKWKLPESFLIYETVFEIVAILLLYIFLLSCVPCAVYSIFLAAVSMIRDKRFLLPLISVLLDASLIYIWIYALRMFILTQSVT